MSNKKGQMDMQAGIEPETNYVRIIFVVILIAAIGIGLYFYFSSDEETVVISEDIVPSEEGISTLDRTAPARTETPEVLSRGRLVLVWGIKGCWV